LLVAVSLPLLLPLKSIDRFISFPRRLIRVDPSERSIISLLLIRV